MIVLYILAGTIASIALLLSLRAHLHVEYDGDEISAYGKWASVKFQLLPLKEKPPKKKEKKKEEPKKEPEQKEEKEEEKKEPKPKGVNPLSVLYENEQIDGILEILNKLLGVIDKFGSRLVNAFVIDEMFLDITVSKEDAASTAEAYGKMCRRVFPVTGAVCANCNVKKYSINIDPDYLAEGRGEVAFSMEMSLHPRRLIHSVLMFAFGAVFKVGLRLLKGIRPKTKVNNSESGAK